MPAKFNLNASRTSLDLPEATRAQLAELMSDNDETLKDCVIICIAERWQREYGTPERDLVADVDRILAKLGMA
jgi:hypothetical protein